MITHSTDGGRIGSTDGGQLTDGGRISSGIDGGQLFDGGW